jgi:hypothetical protein
MESLPLITVLIGVIASIILAGLKSLFDAVSNLKPLVKQIVVVAISGVLIAGLHFFNFTMIPEIYRTPLVGIIQAIVAGLAGIGAHNVKDAVVGNRPGV